VLGNDKLVRVSLVVFRHSGCNYMVYSGIVDLKIILGSVM
jgi:hypothetical protein